MSKCSGCVTQCKECGPEEEDGPWAEGWDKRSEKGPEISDGSSADYYRLPAGATELQHLISAKNMNAQIGEMFRALYRMGEVSHSPRERDLKKIIFYAEAELERLKRYGSN